MRPTHSIENDVLYSKSTDLNVNLIFIKRNFMVTYRLEFDPISVCYDLAKLTHNINTIYFGVEKRVCFCPKK